MIIDFNWFISHYIMSTNWQNSQKSQSDSVHYDMKQTEIFLIIFVFSLQDL